MMTIHIKDVVLTPVIGIHAYERGDRQDIVMNLKVTIDASRAVTSDKIHDTVDYEILTAEIMEAVDDSAFKLIESLAHYILDLVMGYEHVVSSTIELDKPKALRTARSVSVCATREK